MRRTLPIALAAVLFAGGAAACGDDGGGGGGGTTSPEAFCAEAATLEERFAVLDDQDPAAMEEALNTMEAMAVPEDLRSSWDTMISGMRRFIEAFEGVDTSDPEAALEALSVIAENEEEFANFEEATTNIENYVEEECEITFGE